MTQLTVTLLSNGHGEDSIGASLATELHKQHPNIKLQAFPTVDSGKAYEGLGIDILGPRKVMPSGGLLMHNWQLFQSDIRAGFLPMTLKQLQGLRALKTDALITIGDGYGLLLSGLVQTTQRFYVQTLVSVHHSKQSVETIDKRRVNRFFMENFSYPERVLMRQLMKHAYVRDDATATALQDMGLKHVSSLGNPMLDQLSGKALTKLLKPVVTLLPGTRLYSEKALSIMLSAVRLIPNLTALVAWAGQKLPDQFEGWQDMPSQNEKGLLRKLESSEGGSVLIFEGRFADCLVSADLVLGTSGTANEQAAALGKPVISFPIEPLYSASFLENQKRLLSYALTLCSAEPKSIADAIEHLLSNEKAYQLASVVGQARMGASGGSQRIVQDILNRIELAI